MPHRGLVRSFVNSGRWVGQPGDLRWRSWCSCSWKGCEWSGLPEAYEEVALHVLAERWCDWVARQLPEAMAR